MKKGVLLILLLITAVTQVNAFEFCDDGIVGEDMLRIISVDDMLKDNSQEWQWESSQNVELEIRLENRDENTKDYILEAVFIEDGDKVKIAEDSEDLKEEIQLLANERKSISLNFQIDEDTEVSNYELYIKFHKAGDEDKECVENAEEQITIEKIELCDDGNVDRDDLEITRITDEKRDNDEEWNWIPGSEVEVLIDISNKEYSERDFVVELIMLNADKEEIEFSDDETRIENTIEINEDESETIEFIFELNKNIEEGDYTFYAKVYDENDYEICTTLKAEERSSPKEISIERVENSIDIKEVIGPKEIRTNSIAKYTAKIINMGSEDEKKVSIIMYNRVLGIKETIEIEDLKSAQETEVKFNLQLPLNATLGDHKILFTAEYKYDDKRNAYKKFSDNDAEIKYLIEVTEGSVGDPLENITNETITNETATENETEIIENETFVEDIIEEEINDIMAPITGNVVGNSATTSVWPITIGFLLLAVIGIFLFFKKPKKKEVEYVEHPVVTRRYTASLD